jgi:hypothetical protein
MPLLFPPGTTVLLKLSSVRNSKQPVMDLTCSRTQARVLRAGLVISMRHLECWMYSAGALYRRCYLSDTREPGASGNDGRHLRQDSCLYGSQLNERVSISSHAIKYGYHLFALGLTLAAQAEGAGQQVFHS